MVLTIWHRNGYNDGSNEGGGGNSAGGGSAGDSAGMVVVAVVATSFNCGGGNLKSNGGCMRMVMLVEFIEFHIFL